MQTKGVAERLNRTLKDQAIHGRIFRNLEAVRQAVTGFRDRYNHHWRVEKPGFMSPLEARQSYAIRNGHPQGCMSCKSVAGQLRAVHLYLTEINT